MCIVIGSKTIVLPTAALSHYYLNYLCFKRLFILPSALFQVPCRVFQTPRIQNKEELICSLKEIKANTDKEI